jgi:hypothetical protein
MRNRILIAAIGFLLVALAVWYFLPEPLYIESRGDNRWIVWLPKRGWRDTDVWVGARQNILITPPDAIDNSPEKVVSQPFSVRIGADEFKSRFDKDAGKFFIGLDTGNIPPSKIYLKLDSAGNADKIPLIMSIVSIPEGK